MDDPDVAQPLAGRVTELETLFTHLQRSVQDLDQVVLDQQKQIDALRGQLARLSRRLDQLAQATPEGEEGP